MTGERIYLYDTTLRDGAQTQDVDFTVADKIAIARDLDALGIDYVEGGWPGANPTDDQFFADPPAFSRAIFTAFGMTRRPGRSAANDPGLAGLFNARCAAVCMVGKTWDFHVDVALGIPRDENLELIRDSVAAARAAKGEALFDAEHFFDGYKRNPAYAASCIKAAYEAGARWVVLCDTNGGTLPHEVEAIVREVVGTHGIPGDRLGIHCHNDTENAVANSLAAVRAGARMIQGTLNGLGERCGNANLVSLIPTLILKMGFQTGVKAEDLPRLTEVSRNLDRILNRESNRHAAYVGASAFAHKGGLHVSAIEKDPDTYEHVRPDAVGNRRRIVVSDQAGRSNVLARLRDFDIQDIDPADRRIGSLVDLIKRRDTEGYAYDAAEASLELLIRSHFGSVPSYFTLERFWVTDERRYRLNGAMITESEAVVKMTLPNDDSRLEAAEGNGPVNALDNALRKALEPYYPALKAITLTDYRVRIIANERGERVGSGTRPRVLITTRDSATGKEWATLGVSTDIINASVDALLDAYGFKLLKDGVEPWRGTAP
ncbi:2-isopropylmalate synthase [Azospirillum fermentarium]|uniref:citramalate synthase n=1 Tax=Azospirillum fermentarium TaxID=1233114 RepID=UPI0022263858|nr:citramalate synthase [Azospirillum fermentarium]MCW2247277.1 2-isopropylmalate synthase [Azospirillum fermentarium]